MTLAQGLAGDGSARRLARLPPDGLLATPQTGARHDTNNQTQPGTRCLKKS